MHVYITAMSDSNAVGAEQVADPEEQQHVPPQVAAAEDSAEQTGVEPPTAKAPEAESEAAKADVEGNTPEQVVTDKNASKEDDSKENIDQAPSAASELEPLPEDPAKEPDHVC